MPTSTTVAHTPRYVLIDGDHRIGPKITALPSGGDSLLIYGFSSKSRYEEFCANQPLGLKPYPLVKGYLRNQINESSHCLNLVVLDPRGTNEPLQLATTMQAVLDAQETLAAKVNMTYRLVFNHQADAYSVEATGE